MANETAAEAARAAADATIASYGAKAGVGGGIVAVGGAITLSELAMIVGIIVGIGGFIVQIAAQWHAARIRERADKRAKALYEARMAAIAKTGKDPVHSNLQDLEVT